jgi:N-acetylglutamate synthase-like GNAT family acetyltransferase
MNGKIVVQEYESKFLNEVVDLILQIQQDEFNIAITKEDQPDLFQIEEFYQKGKGNFWVATEAEKVVGTISLLDIGNDQVALRKLFVKEEFRGKEYGTGKLLLEQAKNWAKEKDIKEIYLGTTPAFLAAHRFYEKNNFVEIREDDLPSSFPILKVDKKFYRYRL